MNLNIRQMRIEDLTPVSDIAKRSFSGLNEGALEWVRCNFGAYPRCQYFVSEFEEKILGYILWLEKGGFRKESVWELEQMAVDKDHRGRGIGTRLITESRTLIEDYVKRRGGRIRLIEVTTGTENDAQKLYQKTLDARVEAYIRSLFRGDEVIMVARY